MTRSTHTYAMLELSYGAYIEIAGKLKSAGYEHAFLEEGISMQGIAICPASDKASEPDFFWREDDPEDNGDSPENAMSCAPFFAIDKLHSSYTGPTRFYFRTPTLDPESDDEECLGFDTCEEAHAAIAERIAALKAIGKYEE